MRFHWVIPQVVLIGSLIPGFLHAQQAKAHRLSRSEYEDRAKAGWLGQIIGTLAGFQFEGKPASTVWVDRFPKNYEVAPVDDDYYYELVALRAFEKYGIDMNVDQLGRQWAENSAGTWGSSEQTRLLLTRGIKPPDTGHPRYNRLWYTIGPQFSGDVYGLLAPGMPNLAAKLARYYGHINGYAEGTDGAVFVAGMVSLAFTEKDPKVIVRKAARLIHPDSPYRRCIDEVISMAAKGLSPDEIGRRIEDRWHVRYQVMNNAVANGGLVAASVWFGEADYMKTINLAFRLADFADTDCNAANAGGVVAVLRGMQGLPRELVASLNDRIAGENMGRVRLTPAVDERISDLAARTVAVGEKLLLAYGAKEAADDGYAIPPQTVVTQPAELFSPGDLMAYWNPDWRLERATYAGPHGSTHLDGGVLATFPEDHVRGLVMRRTVRLGANSLLRLEVAADPGRAWVCEVYADNVKLLSRAINGGVSEREWQHIEVPLGAFSGKETALRVFQLISVPSGNPGTAYWRNLQIQ